MDRVRLWLRNPRNFVILGGLSASLVATMKACPQLFPDQFYLPIMEAYKGGTRVKLSRGQQQEFQEVLEELQVSPEAYRPFTTSRWDIKVKGQPYLPNGVVVGIPMTFVDEPDLGSSKFADSIRARMKSEQGVAFRESMALSREARKFALAREVVLADRCYSSYPLIIAPFTVLAGFGSVFAIQVAAGQLGLFLPAALIGSTLFVIYRYFLGQLNQRNDLKSDRLVSELGRTYVEGGIEYYEKCLARNKALRSLLGAKGEKMYNYHGNMVQGMLSTSGALLTVKRRKLADVLKHSQANDDPTKAGVTDQS